jgi:hypothetical protein
VHLNNSNEIIDNQLSKRHNLLLALALQNLFLYMKDLSLFTHIGGSEPIHIGECGTEYIGHAI